MLHNACLQVFALVVVVFVAARVTRAQPLVKNRPYEFGFTVDEQQHRFEKQDERGIVMGEFGFITADGIYHVTVYATDEEGRFRILAMKSYPYETPPKRIEMMVQPKTRPLPATTTTTTKAPFTLPKFHSNSKACSGCFIPKDTPSVDAGAVALAAPAASSAILPPVASAAAPAVAPKSGKTPIRTLSRPLPPEIEVQDEDSEYPAGPPSGDNDSGDSPSRNSPPQAQTTASIAPTASPANIDLMRNIAQKAVRVLSGGKPPKNGENGNGQGNAVVSGGKGESVGQSGGGGAVPLGIGSRFGLSDDDTGDLYRFKYVLDYNGHEETGGRDGNKRGSYFAIGDDNVQRTIEYVANESGYRPRIRWRKLDTQLPAENALKEYEFVWFRKDGE